MKRKKRNKMINITAVDAKEELSTLQFITENF